jgi:hypothetical protein
MRLAVVVFLLMCAASASAKGGRGGQQGAGAPAAAPVDPAYQKTVDAMRAQAPDSLPSTFRTPTASESLIAAWKASWDRPALLKEHLDRMWGKNRPAADRATLFHSLYTGTAAEPAIHDGIARYVRAQAPAAADQILGPPAGEAVATAPPATAAPAAGTPAAAPPATGTLASDHATAAH